MPALPTEIRFALRMFAKNPGATAIAVLSLAIAIGPNSALFSILDRLLLRPSPVPELDRVFRIFARSDTGWEGLSYADYLDYRQQSQAPAGILAYEKRGAIWNTGGQRELLWINIVSENYFSTLDVKPALGRCFLPGHDERFEGEPPVVISHSLWQRRFAGDPDVVGKTMLLNGRGFNLIGVAARDFRGLETLIPNDVWVPFSAASVLAPGNGALLARRDYRGISVLARLRPGAPKEQAEAELSGIAARLAEAYPATNKGKTVVLSSEENDRRGRALLGLIVLSLIGLVLLIACANVSGILLAQGETRRREIAVRLALGAGRGRLVRQLLVEGVLISVAAAALGLLLALWFAELVPALKPPALAFLSYDVGLDGRVLAYTLLLALATTLAFGLVPALRASHPDIVAALKGESVRGGSRLFSVRGLLVIGQIATAQFLLAGAGLLLRSYFEFAAIRPGFDAHKDLLLVTLVPDRGGVPTGFGDLVEKIRALPGVRRVSVSKNLPLSGSGHATEAVSVPGVTESPVPVGFNVVGPEFFSVMGTHILRGREFDSRDRRTVALVNETMARQLWGSPGDALGRFFKIGSTDFQVVGVVEDGRYRTLTESPMPYMFLPLPAAAQGEGTLLIETATDPGQMAGTVRKTLLAAKPGLIIAGLTTLRQHLRGFALFGPRMAAGFVAVIGLLGIFLASVGLYGVISYSVNRRAHEIGVRVALGAQPRDVLTLVLRQAARLVLAGAAIGLAAALVSARVASAALYNVSAADPAALFGSAGIVTAVAVFAAYTPVRRALRLHPIAVLRQE